ATAAIPPTASFDLRDIIFMGLELAHSIPGQESGPGRRLKEALLRGAGLRHSTIRLTMRHGNPSLRSPHARTPTFPRDASLGRPGSATTSSPHILHSYMKRALRWIGIGLGAI